MPEVIYDGSMAEARANELQNCLLWNALLDVVPAEVEMILVTDFLARPGFDICGAYVPHEETRTICVNPTDDDPVFVLAHELAHHYLHQDINATLCFKDDSYYRRIEDEADAWARDLLAGIRERLAVHFTSNKGGRRDGPQTPRQP